MLLLLLSLLTTELSGDWMPESVKWERLGPVDETQYCWYGMLLQIRNDQFCIVLGTFQNYTTSENLTLSSGDGYRAWWGRVKQDGDKITLTAQGYWEAYPIPVKHKVTQLILTRVESGIFLEDPFFNKGMIRLQPVEKPIEYQDEGMDAFCTRFDQSK